MYSFTVWRFFSADPISPDARRCRARSLRLTALACSSDDSRNASCVGLNRIASTHRMPRPGGFNSGGRHASQIRYSQPASPTNPAGVSTKLAGLRRFPLNPWLLPPDPIEHHPSLTAVTTLHRSLRRPVWHPPGFAGGSHPP